MPRAARITFEQGFYHVYNRGLNKQTIYTDADDYQKFLSILADLKTKLGFDLQIYTYVLMPNHFHLLIQTLKTPLATIMRSLTVRYVLYFNRKYERVGIMFQNRFKSKLCQKDRYFLGASRYIHLNPIAAGLAADLASYPWSSYQELFGNSDRHIIDKVEVKRLIGESHKEQDEYKRFLMEGVNKYRELEVEFFFDHEVGGSAHFHSLSQKKFYRRRLVMQ